MKRFGFILLILNILCAKAQVATFEYEEQGVHLQKLDTVWQGADSPVSKVNDWKSGDFHFTTYKDDSWGVPYYYGFTVSSETDSVSSGWEQPYRSACGGAYEGQNFCVWYDDFYGTDSIFWVGNMQGKGVMITNTAYTVKSMSESYRMATSFTDKDYLLLYFIGHHYDRTTDSVAVYLAQDGKYIREWTWIDLSKLGEVNAITLAMDGSDKTGGFLNTPSYVALDNLGMVQPESYVAPEMAAFPKQTDLEELYLTPACHKVLRHGEIRILRGEHEYDIMGRLCP